MSASVFTFYGTTSALNKTSVVKVASGTVAVGQSGLFTPSEVNALTAQGIALLPGPAQSPASQLTAPTAAAGSSGSPNGTYLCCVTFVTAAGETMAGPEAAVTVTNEEIDWSAIPTGSNTSGVIARKLYRTAAGGASGTEKLVAKFSDNTTTTYTDDVADSALGAALPTTDSSWIQDSQINSLDQLPNITPNGRAQMVALIQSAVVGSGGGGSSGMQVGKPVSGATDNALLGADGSGNLASGPATSSVVTGSGTPTSGQVPVYTGTGNETTPGSGLPGIVTPEHFGAIGDGTTDDTTALQDGLDYIHTNGGTLFLTPGKTYVYTSTLNLGGATHHRRITSPGGAMEDSTVLLCRVPPTAGAASGLIADSAEGLEIDHITFEYDDSIFTGASTFLLNMTSTSGGSGDVQPFSIHDCSFRASSSGVYGCQSLLRLNQAIIGVIRSCSFANGQEAIRVGDPGGSYVNSVSIEECVFNNCAASYIMVGSDDCEAFAVRHCTFENCPTNAAIYGNPGTPYGNLVYQAVIDSCWFGDSTNSTGVWISGLFTEHNCLIIGNYFGSNAYHIEPVNEVVLIGNAFETPTNYVLGGQHPQCVSIGNSIDSTSAKMSQYTTLGKWTDVGETQVTSASLTAAGISGTAAAARFVGAVNGAAPTTGTFAHGDFVIDLAGGVWVCSVAGTPGTWVQVNGTTAGTSAPLMDGTATAGSSTSFSREDHVHPTDTSLAPITNPTFTGIATSPVFSASGLTGATSGARFVGATTSGAPVSGTFLTGDWIVDQSGAMWVCTAGGSPGTWVEIGASSGSSLTQVASTGASGYALANNTDTILSWTAPSDGELHAVIVVASVVVTSTETGGAIRLYSTAPTGSVMGIAVDGGGHAAGTYGATAISGGNVVGPGKTASVAQFSALTAGAATLYAAMYAA